MSLFPDGRPTHLLGELSYNSDAESEDLSKNNPRHSREPRVPRPVVPWVEYDIVVLNVAKTKERYPPKSERFVSRCKGDKYRNLHVSFQGVKETGNTP